MSKFLAVPVVALVGLSGSTAHNAAADRDRDGLPDRWEKRYGLSTAKKNARRDPDKDRLRNRREYKLRLHPRRADTDRDGLRDRAELVKYKTNPRKADTDGDGFKDGAEVKAGTDPRKRSSRPPAQAPAAGNQGAAPGASAPGAAAAPTGGFPTPASTGVPAGWAPRSVQTASMTVRTPGAVVEDILFTGANLIIEAPNVTVRRVKFEGGQINNQPGRTPCANGLVVEDSSFELAPGQTYDANGVPGIQWGGYTARRVKVWNRSEGLFISGKSFGCGPVQIEDSLIKLNDNNDCKLHADGMQGYGGNHVVVRNVVADSSKATCGTAPFFYPHSQGNTSADIDRLMVIGGGYSFRLGMPATVKGLRVVDRSWAYGPIDVKCSVVSGWEASVVTITPDYQVARTVRPQPCNMEAGG